VFGIVAVLFLIAAWFATLVRGRTPQGLHDMIAAYIRYQSWVWAYVFLITDRFPPFTGAPAAYVLDVMIDPPERQSRWSVGFRLLLAIPVLAIEALLENILHTVAFFGWFTGLVLGRLPAGFRSFGVFGIAYRAKTFGYLMLLTGTYPALDFPKPG
jgi:hypothetical protein